MSEGPSDRRDEPGPPAPDVALSRGDTVGRYVILGSLGSSGWGTIYSAYDPELDRQVALKFAAAGDGAESQARRFRRLQREARAMARINHPNTVAVHDVGEHEGRVFVAMEFIEGRTLTQWLKAAPRTWREIVAVYGDAGRGLAAAHDKKLVHRDFRPDSVLIASDGRVCVTDFGFAQAWGPRSTEAPVSSELSGAEALVGGSSRHSVAVGLPGYVAPEQMQGASAAAAADQFSFCASLYEALYEQQPFVGETPARQRMAQLAGEVGPAPAGTRVPERLRRVLLRGLSSEADARYESMEALLAALQGPARRYRSAMILGGIAAVGLASLTLWQLRERAAAAECGGGAAELEQVWSETRQSRLQQVFEDTGSGYATQALDRVSEQAIAYVVQWSETDHQVCDAARTGVVALAPTLRARACLKRRRDAFDSALSVLEEVDASTIYDGAGLIAELPSAPSCLGKEVTADAAGTVSGSADVAELQRLLARAKNLSRVGRRDEAAAIAERVAASAHGLDAGAVEVGALLVLGGVAERRGSNGEARRHYEAALELAGGMGDDSTAADAAVLLTLLVGYGEADPDGGRAWGRVAEMFFERADLDPGDSRRAALLSHLAITTAEESVADGIVLFEQALVIAKDLPAGVQPSAAMIRNNLANLLVRVGRYDEAAAEYQRVIDEHRENLGSGHPATATAIGNLGIVLLRLGRSREAVELGEEALRLRRAAHGPDHPAVAASYIALAQALAAMHETRAVADAVEEGTAILAKHGPSYDHAKLLLGSAQLLREDDAVAAMQLLDRTDAVLAELSTGAPTRLHAKSWAVRASFHLAEGELDEALERIRRAYDAARDAGWTESETGEIRTLLGSVLYARRDYDAAAEHLEVVAPSDVRAQVALVVLELGRGDIERAGRYADRAAEMLEAGPELRPVDRAQVAACLASLALARGELDEAIRLVVEVRQTSPTGLPALSETELDIIRADAHVRRGELEGARRLVGRIDARDLTPWDPLFADRLAVVRAAVDQSSSIAR